MAGQNDFKHITVNPADTDDVVIQAGIVEEPAMADGSGDGYPEELVVESAEAAVPDDVLAADPAVAPKAAKPAKAQKPAAKDSYQATTLEDIESFKMSKTQIVVIALAVIAIVAFAIWYFVAS